MKNLAKFAVACLAVLCFAFCLAQTLQSSSVSIREEYQQAYRFYQQSYKAQSEAEEDASNKKARYHFKALLPKLPTTPGVSDSILFRTYYILGELEHYFENLSGALFYYEKAVSLQGRPLLPDSLFFKPLIYSGIIHYHQNKIDRAARLFYRAEAIQSKYASPLEESQRLYNTLGVINYETGNYRQAKHYFQKALELLSPSNPYYEDLSVNYKINLAQIHFKLQAYDEATRIYKTLLRLEKNVNEIYHNLGQISIHVGAARTALAYFRKVSFADERKVRLYNSMGSAYMVLRNVDSARFYLTKAIHDSAAHADQIGVGMALKNMGDLEMLTGNPGKSLQYYTGAVHRFYPAYTDTSVNANPRFFSGIFSYLNLFETLVAKAVAAHDLYKREKRLEWAKEELEAYQSAFSLMAYVERTYNSDEARLFLNQSKYAVHSQPIDIAFELYSKTGDTHYLQTLYELDQQNKASVLALRQYMSAQSSIADSSFFQQEKLLRTAITRLSLRASQVKDSAQLAALSRAIRDQEIQLAYLQNRQEAQTGDADIPSLRFLQEQLLDASTALVSYHLSTDRLTSFIITRNAVNCYQQPLPAYFQAQIQTYIQVLRSPEKNQQAHNSRLLFNLLFPVPLKENITRLLIIPDDELLFLPFETLQTQKGEYLVQRYSVQYQYSTALLKRQKMALSGEKTLAIAPFTQTEWHLNKDTLPVLPYSLQEIENSRGKKLSHTAATKKAFFNNISQYKILHLATHAKASPDPGASYIAFYPQRGTDMQAFLFTEEIYHLPLHNTQLAILSACETGSGNLVKGEGVMSLSRAFRYAGCPNVITSLWKADDFSTAWLVQTVNTYIDKGYTIDAALQQAKLDYLADAKIHPRLKQPYYWAHFVFIGNFEPQTSSLLPYAAMVLLFTIPLLFFLWRKRKRNMSSASKGI